MFITGVQESRRGGFRVSHRKSNLGHDSKNKPRSSERKVAIERGSNECTGTVSKLGAVTLRAVCRQKVLQHNL